MTMLRRRSSRLLHFASLASCICLLSVDTGFAAHDGRVLRRKVTADSDEDVFPTDSEVSPPSFEFDPNCYAYIQSAVVASAGQVSAEGIPIACLRQFNDYMRQGSTTRRRNQETAPGEASAYADDQAGQLEEMPTNFVSLTSSTSAPSAVADSGNNIPESIKAAAPAEGEKKGGDNSQSSVVIAVSIVGAVAAIALVTVGTVFYRNVQKKNLENERNSMMTMKTPKDDKITPFDIMGACGTLYAMGAPNTNALATSGKTANQGAGFMLL